MTTTAALAVLLSVLCGAEAAADQTSAAGAPALTSEDAPALQPLTRARLVGEIEILGPGESEYVRLCENGRYVRFHPCGGYTRGTWRLDPEGLSMQAEEVCLVKGVPETELGATDACLYFERYVLLGCMPPHVAQARAAREGLEYVLLDAPWSAETLQAIFTGARDRPDGLTLHHTPEPRACDPHYRPRAAGALLWTAGVSARTR